MLDLSKSFHQMSDKEKKEYKKLTGKCPSKKLMSRWTTRLSKYNDEFIGYVKEGKKTKSMKGREKEIFFQEAEFRSYSNRLGKTPRNKYTK